MIKIVALLALVAVATAAPGAIIAAVGHTPASTGPLAVAAPVAVAPLAHPVALAAPAPVAFAAAPVALPAPAHVAIPAPVAYTTGVRITHIHEPVEQHGYQIAY